MSVLSTQFPDYAFKLNPNWSTAVTLSVLKWKSGGVTVIISYLLYWQGCVAEWSCVSYQYQAYAVMNEP